MSRRKKTSGGQALVMVTLALFAMTGIMGLAVDMGWSFFVQKRAQAAADAAALGAVQEAFVRMRAGGLSVSGFTCASGGTSSTTVECTGNTIEYCGSTVVTASNLNNGCKYALTNGFDPSSGNQRISMQSNDGQVGDRPVFPNINGVANPAPVNMTYWVTAGTVQTVPQLFSVILGNNTAVVSAVATAAVAASISPGSFFGMNQAGDCWGFPGSTTNCGLDIDDGAKGSVGTCPGGTGTGTICAPAGVVLASTCPNNPSGVTNPCTGDSGPCSDGKDCAGDAENHGGIMTSSLTINGSSAATGGDAPGDWHNSAGTAITPVYSTSPGLFQDFFVGNTQPPLLGTPPLQGPSAIGSCGIPGGTMPAGTWGPFQYYSYSVVGAMNVPDGNPISIGGAVTFSSSGACTGTGAVYTAGAAQPYPTFPTYIFYGGMYAGGTLTLGPGQYVMAGTNTSGGNVLNVDKATITGDTASGTMIILTDGGYPGLGYSIAGASTPVSTGLPTQISKIPNYTSMPTLYQGSVTLKNPSVTLTGAVNSGVSGSALPTNLDAYTGVAIWQDRRNSMIEYNDYPALAPNCGSNCTTDDGTFVGCANNGAAAGQCVAAQTLAELQTDNHVTATSPWLNLDPGNGSFNITGAYYQPRGAWMSITHGNGFGGGAFQVITGSFVLTSGTDKLLLAGPTNPIITYKPVLIR